MDAAAGWVLFTIFRRHRLFRVIHVDEAAGVMCRNENDGHDEPCPVVPSRLAACTAFHRSALRLHLPGKAEDRRVHRWHASGRVAGGARGAGIQAGGGLQRDCNIPLPAGPGLAPGVLNHLHCSVTLRPCLQPHVLLIRNCFLDQCRRATSCIHTPPFGGTCALCL